MRQQTMKNLYDMTLRLSTLVAVSLFHSFVQILA